mmetsp:Transcript_7987/g.7072  ORF Transcript_7987/g.7072 Transcript_7987/m.7072 type:complete len:144 (-) Transcript_7987:52-483(-)
MKQNPSIIIYHILLVLSINIFEVSGVSTTKLGSSAQRCTIDISRIILIWGFFLVYPDKGHENFDIVEFIGFIGIVIGTVIFNEIYVPPIFNFNINTKSNIANRDQKEGAFKLLEEDEDIKEGLKNNYLNGSSNEKTDSAISHQ